MLSEIYHVPYPMPYHGVTVEHSLQALEQLFKADVDPPGSRRSSSSRSRRGRLLCRAAELLRRLRSLCDSHGIVLIADEIQTGFARTGRMFAVEHAGIEPDLMAVAKSVAGGLPLSAVIGKADIMAPRSGRTRRHIRRLAAGLRAGLAVLQVIVRSSC